MLNQEVHKNLRRNKSGVRTSSIEPLPSTYVRPPGFFLVPKLLNASNSKADQASAGAKRSESPATSYYNNIKNELNR